MTAIQPDLSSLRIARDAPPPEPSGRRYTTLVVGALIVLAVVGLGAWFYPRTPVVHVAQVRVVGGAQTPQGAITANGYIVARTKAEVASKIPGRLETLSVSEGSEVKAGDVLGKLESRTYEASLDAARATTNELNIQLHRAQTELSRVSKLKDQRLTTDAAHDDAQAQVDVLSARRSAADAGVRLAEANLENTRIRAPFSGTVLKKSAEVGEMVGVQGASVSGPVGLVTLADLSTLEVEVDVNEAYIARIKNSSPVRITLDAYSDTSFAGVVRQVVPTADRAKATVQVKVSITDRDPRILPEMAAKVTFLAEGTAVVQAAMPRKVYVAQAALVTDSGKTSVWVVEKEAVAKHDVQLGETHGDDIEVRSGLSGDESVVLLPDATLKEGIKVVINKEM